MTQENKIADSTENTGKYGRRATDNTGLKKDMPYPTGSLFRWLINGITVGGVITAIFISGRASHTLDTTVKNIDRHEIYIVKMLETQTELMLSIKDNTKESKKNSEFMDKFFEQQKESDKEFLDVIKEIKSGVQNNTKDIIILQQKVSLQDKLSVYEMALRQ